MAYFIPGLSGDDSFFSPELSSRSFMGEAESNFNISRSNSSSSRLALNLDSDPF